jgi:hypothetical protein
MEGAYTNLAGRAAVFHNEGNGNIGGLTLGPGVHSWNGNVNISSNVTIAGNSPTAWWVFQIAGTLYVAPGKAVVLGGTAQARHIFWVVAGATTLDTTSHLEGNVFDATNIAMKTGASINGRLLAQTAVTLQMNTVTLPH